MIKSLELTDLLEITSNPDFQKIRDDYENLHSRSRGISTPEDLLQLQIDLLEKIIPIEKQISALKNKSDSVEKNDYWFTRELYKIQRKALKQIMDGLCWRYLGYKRSTLRKLADHNKVGHFDDGLLSELTEAERLVGEGSYVLINDLSHTLKYGDLTVIKDNNIGFYEIKTTKMKSGKRLRQRNKLRDTVDMLNDGKSKIAGHSADIVSLPIKPKNFIKKVEALAEKAYTGNSGMASSKVSPYIWISCIYLKKIRELHSEQETLPTIPKSPFKSSIYFLPISNFTLMDVFSPNIAPYTIYPFSDALVTDLELGNMFVSVSIGEKELIKSLKGKGWVLTLPSRQKHTERANLTKPEDVIAAVHSPEYNPKLTKGNFNTVLSWDMFFRISTEFMSIKTIVENAEYLKSNSKSMKGRVTFDFKHEHTQWN